MNALPRELPLLLLSLFLIATPLCANDILWDGGGDGASWSDAGNWGGDVLPGAGDHAIITLDGTYTIRLTANVSIAGLTIGGSNSRQTLDASGFYLSLGVDSSTIKANGVLIIGGATTGNSFVLSIDGPLMVHGRFDWTNGQILANTYYQPPNGRVITVAPDGVMRWIGSGERYISATLDNQGTLRWEEGLTYYMQGYSHTSSGTFEIALTADATFTRGGINSQGPWVFTNTGTIRKTGLGAATIQIEMRTIGGSVDVEEDTLLQNYRSRWENATVSVAAGATLHLAANRMFEPHTIAGTLSGNPVGTFLVSGIGAAGYFTTLDADTSGGVVDIGGTGLQLGYVELGGVYDPPAKTYSPAPTNRGLMRLVGSQEKTIDGQFVNEDTLRWEGGNLVYYVTAGPTGFTNKAIFEMAIDDTLDFRTGGINSSRPGPFFNTGRVLKTGTGRVSSKVDFHTIGGLVDVRGGAIMQEDPSRWEDATIAVSAGATLQLAGYFKQHVIAGTLRGDPQGTFLASGFVYSYYTQIIADTVRGGRLEIGGTGLQLIDVELGTTTGLPAPVNGGLLRFVGNTNLFVRTNFRNEGTLRWEKGNPYANQGILIANAGMFEVFSNDGVFNAYGGPGTLTNEASGTVRKIDTVKSTFGLTFVNQGKLCVAGGTLIVESASLNEFRSTASGIIAGVGTLDLSKLTDARLHNDGTTAPGPGDGGEGIGTLTIRGPLPEHRFEFELAGTDSAQYDRLIVIQSTPNISPDTAAVRLLGGFKPVLGNFFDVIAGPVVGQLQAVVTSPPTVKLFAIYPTNLVRLVLDTATTPNDAATILVTAPSVTARQGERVDIPITVVATAAARSAGATEVTFALRFNATLLVPIESTPKGTAQAGERVIGMRIPLSSTGDTTVLPLRFEATLGDDSTTALTIDNPATNVGNVTITARDGRFTLLDLCYQGGARLLNPDGVIAMSKIRSNPGSQEVSFDLDLIESGTTRIMLSDLSGILVWTFIDEDLPRGRQRVQLNVEDFTSGRYFLIVQTPTVRLIEQVEVIR